ncbi:MAG: class I SAM-dependent methyltransferase [Leptolyngbya sp. DLM2.Bin15]|nr:MAG: class I SAM-dependent methyltransferase [Leptolyngbya sp. DLM2.Bin15]
MTTNHRDNNLDLSDQNKKAWDSLYASTEDFVWGFQPIGFIDIFIPYIKPRLSNVSCILDAGAGEGRNLPQLLALSDHIVACDASGNALGKIPTAIRASLKIVTCDLEAIPFDDGFFDVILLADVVETLPDPQPVLRELHRLLKPGGLLLCNIPGFEDGIAEIDMETIGENQYLYQGRYFYRFVHQDEAIALLESCGFKMVHHQLCSWVEAAHPSFRSDVHTHSSYVFLVEKAG